MAILLTEDVRALAEWPAILPTRRGGRKIHTSTLYRWALHGVRGVKLESLQLGGTLATSREALERFFGELARVKAEGVAYSHPTRTRSTLPANRLREISQANAAAAEALR